MALTFCEKYMILRDPDLECWACELNIMNGGSCCPSWDLRFSESEIEE
ncbi:MAG: hypothetical protein ACOC5L_01590 [Halobacteriota archaeon]